MMSLIVMYSIVFLFYIHFCSFPHKIHIKTPGFAVLPRIFRRFPSDLSSPASLARESFRNACSSATCPPTPRAARCISSLGQMEFYYAYSMGLYIDYCVTFICIYIYIYILIIQYLCTYIYIYIYT